MDGITNSKPATGSAVSAEATRQPKFHGAARGAGGHAHMLAVDLPSELGGDAIASEWGGPQFQVNKQ
ncbi:hypothetical protein J2847_005833 [Azospirillum agricola]|uniref:hypothetical protein n=1 Tax=Azospirillum agricola TaxID=1720247 RepID=UPI001AE23661|nr:hypothetical protein [Azospirillum agricola]MBP2232504.1 hypothetical protein [Azospirillum agricola]